LNRKIDSHRYSSSLSWYIAGQYQSKLAEAERLGKEKEEELQKEKENLGEEISNLGREIEALNGRLNDEAEMVNVLKGQLSEARDVISGKEAVLEIMSDENFQGGV